MTPPPGPAGPLTPRRLLAAAGPAVAVPVLTIGALLVALSGRGGPRAAGLVLLVAGLLAAVAGPLTLRPGADARRLLLGGAGALLLAGAVAVGLLVASGPVLLLDLLIVGGVPAFGGVVLALLARLGGEPRGGR